MECQSHWGCCFNGSEEPFAVLHVPLFPDFFAGITVKKWIKSAKVSRSHDFFFSFPFFIFGSISHKSVVQYRTLLSVVPLKPAPTATPLRTLSFAELQGIPGLATIKTVVNLKPLQSRALVCQTMMTQCPVRPVMTEIYTLLLEPGPSALPSETPSSLQQAEGGGGRGLRQSNRSQLMHWITSQSIKL